MAFFAVTGLLVAACSGAQQGAAESIETTVAASPQSISTSTTSLPSDTTLSSVSTPKGPEQEVSPFIEGSDLDVVLLQNPMSGGGTLPEFAWGDVESVERYDVFVFDRSGDVYWSWSTGENSVFLGGIGTKNPDVPGPRIVPGMTWSVLGFDVSGTLIAQSELRPIAP